VESNDISTFAPIQQGCIFEGVLASPPTGTVAKYRASKASRQHEWHRYIGLWVPHEMPIKSLVDLVNRRRIGVEVYTLLPPGAADAIEGWLFRKGVSVAVLPYDSLSVLADDLRYHHPSMVVHVANEDQARMIGVKARVVRPDGTWVL